jgi:putative MATE family efflux protein
MVREKEFYRKFFTMAVVLILQNVITLSVNLADNIMLGAYSEVSLSGVAAVNQVQFIYQQILLAIGEGIVILGAQYYGKGQIRPIKRIAAGAMRFALLVAVGLFVLVSCCPHLILSAFTTDEAIILQGMEYIRVIRYTYIFFAVTQILLATLRSAGVVQIALYLSVCALGINCVINYILIYGHFGAPRLGVTGAAIGTLTARVAELGILILYIRFREKKLLLRLRDYLKMDAGLWKDYIRVIAPILVVNGLWGLNTAAQNAILGHMTAQAIAANSVASTLFMMVKSTAVGSASAASFLIGKTIGEGNQQKLRQYSRTMQVLFVAIGIFSGILLFFIRIPILSLYQLEAGTRDMADQFLLILCVVVVGMSYQMPTNTGIVRGGGDTKFVMKLDLISIWGIVIPLSFIMAFVMKASPSAVLWCLNADQLFKCVPAFLKVNYGHWAKKLTRSKE